MQRKVLLLSVWKVVNLLIWSPWILGKGCYSGWTVASAFWLAEGYQPPHLIQLKRKKVQSCQRCGTVTLLWSRGWLSFPPPRRRPPCREAVSPPPGLWGPTQKSWSLRMLSLSGKRRIRGKYLSPLHISLLFPKGENRNLNELFPLEKGLPGTEAEETEDIHRGNNI